MALLHSLRIWLRRAFQFVLCLLGRVPVHVAFVMDGNRRYAERQHVDKATGHTHGYGKMVDVIHWCIELGVKYITVYAFSIDNFKRSPDEVGALMRLAEEKYAELAQDNGLAEREGIRMRIVGDLQLPPPAVQGAAARLMRGTDRLRSKRATLNVCFSYTASEETVAAVHELQSAVRSGRLQPDDVTPEALAGALRTGAACPPVDLLIRTSGETRLSDFLLWQASHAHLCYRRTLWPNLSYWDFARCVLSYQRHAGALAALRRRATARLAQVAGGGLADEAGEGRWQQQQRQQRQQQADEAGAGVAEAEHGDAHNPEPDGVMAGQAGGTAVRRSCGAQPSGVPTAAGAGDAAAAPAGRAGAAEEEEEEEEDEEAPGSQAAAAAAAGESASVRRRPCSAAATASTASGSGEGTGCGSGDSSAGRGGLDGPAGPLLRQQQPLAWFRSFWSRWWWWWRWQWPALGAQLCGWSGRRRGCRGGGKGDASPAAAAEAAAGGGGGGAGGEVRLLRFFEGLEQVRVAWIATHVDL